MVGAFQTTGASRYTLAQSGDLDAFTAIVVRFQDMAVGYAYAVLKDFHLAQDAAQEAFLTAYTDLHMLHQPGYLRLGSAG